MLLELNLKSPQLWASDGVMVGLEEVRDIRVDGHHAHIQVLSRKELLQGDAMLEVRLVGQQVLERWFGKAGPEVVIALDERQQVFTLPATLQRSPARTRNPHCFAGEIQNHGDELHDGASHQHSAKPEASPDKHTNLHRPVARPVVVATEAKLLGAPAQIDELHGIAKLT